MRDNQPFRLAEVEHYVRFKTYHPDTKEAKKNGLRKYSKNFWINIHDKFVYKQNIRKHGQVVKKVLAEVVQDESEKEYILSSFHVTKGRHNGQTRMLNMINEHYYWPSRVEDIKKTIQSCKVCRGRTKSGKKYEEEIPSSWLASIGGMVVECSDDSINTPINSDYEVDVENTDDDDDVDIENDNDVEIPRVPSSQVVFVKRHSIPANALQSQLDHSYGRIDMTESASDVLNGGRVVFTTGKHPPRHSKSKPQLLDSETVLKVKEEITSDHEDYPFIKQETNTKMRNVNIMQLGNPALGFEPLTQDMENAAEILLSLSQPRKSDSEEESGSGAAEQSDSAENIGKIVNVRSLQTEMISLLATPPQVETDTKQGITLLEDVDHSNIHSMVNNEVTIPSVSLNDSLGELVTGVKTESATSLSDIQSTQEGKSEARVTQPDTQPTESMVTVKEEPSNEVVKDKVDNSMSLLCTEKVLMSDSSEEDVIITQIQRPKKRRISEDKQPILNIQTSDCTISNGVSLLAKDTISPPSNSRSPNIQTPGGTCTDEVKLTSPQGVISSANSSTLNIQSPVGTFTNGVSLLTPGSESKISSLQPPGIISANGLNIQIPGLGGNGGRRKTGTQFLLFTINHDTNTVKLEELKKS